MSWYRIEQEDFYKEDTTLEIEIVCKFEELNEDECGAFLECLTYEEEKAPCLYLYWNCKYLSTFKPPRSVANISTGKDGNGPVPSAEARELLRTTYLRALRDAYSEMQAGKHSRLSQIMQHVSVVDQGDDKYEEGNDIHNLSIAGIADLSNTLLANHTALESINAEMTNILKDKMLLKNDYIKTSLEVAGAKSNKLKREMALLEKLDPVVDKDASDSCGKVGLGTSNIMSMACELLLHKEAAGENKSCFLLIEEPEAHIHAQRQLKLIQSLEEDSEKGSRQIPVVWSYISDGPYRKFSWDNIAISFKHRTNRQISFMSETTTLVVEAIKTLGKNRIDDIVIQILKNRLPDSEKKQILEEATGVSEWIYEVIRKVCL